ncbi:MAG TPA: hypothetical protein PK205_04530 [Promineifilum sp.]|nr:hypothetical protein [Promineifilum sp.]HRQ12551.1 hypothetical protein [Promineifilum sp.]
MTPTPTETPAPTDTPTPTVTPTPLPLPDFADNFDAGLRPEWKLETDDAWASVNGRLTSLRHGYPMVVGDESWTDYTLSLDVIQLMDRCSLSIITDNNDDGRVDKELKMEMNPTNNIYWLIPGTTDVMPGTYISDIGSPFNLKLEVKSDGAVTTLINDEVVTNIVMEGYTQGRISLDCHRPGRDGSRWFRPGSSFDNLQISPLTVP